MHELAERLLQTIRKEESIRPGDRLAAGVSGGADSVALLCLLLELRAELGIVLSVAHINHQLRGTESDEDERFVAKLAKQHGLELHACQAPLSSRSSQDSSVSRFGTEAAARELRYGFFRQLARDGRVGKIATAHTLDDQAETVLLRIFRGTGIRGLSAIHPRIVLEDHGQAFGEFVRPLLGFRHAALQEFLRERGQSWREDSSNRNVAFLRNRLRHRLLPIITEAFGEAAIEHMADLAEIARAEDDHWQCGHPEVAALDGNTSDAPCQAASLPLTPLVAMSLAAQRRLVRAWLQANAPGLSISFRVIEEVLELARDASARGASGKKSAGQKLVLSGHWTLRIGRLPGSEEFRLELESSFRRDKRGNRKTADYDYVLAVPGAVEVPALSACIEARVVDVGSVPDNDRGQLLDVARVPKQVVVRNWRAGDRYWPAHTAAPKKVKELLTDRHATGAEKKLWPVAVAEGCGIIWLRGFAVPAALRPAQEASQAIWIREIAA